MLPWLSWDVAHMTTEQAIQQIRTIRFEPKPTLSSIARAAGISRVTLYNTINTGVASDAVGQALVRGLQAVQNRRC